jgi:hypothetical protein
VDQRYSQMACRMMSEGNSDVHRRWAAYLYLTAPPGFRDNSRLDAAQVDHDGSAFLNLGLSEWLPKVSR